MAGGDCSPVYMDYSCVMYSGQVSAFFNARCGQTRGPCIDDDLSLSDGVEPSGKQNFAAQYAAKVFIIGVLPWRAWVFLDRIELKCF